MDWLTQLLISQANAAPAEDTFAGRWGGMAPAPVSATGTPQQLTENAVGSNPMTVLPAASQPTLGQSLIGGTGGGGPLDISTQGPGGPGAGGFPALNKLQAAARGITALQPPQAQRVATPHAPPMRPIQGGELIQMLAAQGISPQDLGLVGRR